MLAGLLSGCAGQAVQVAALGAAPDPAGDSSFALSVTQASGADAADDPAISALVVDGLRKRGMTMVPGPDAHYLLELGYSDRPRPVGVFVDAPGEAAADPAQGWLVKPEPRRWWTPSKSHACTLTLRLSVTGADKEVYRARATIITARPGCVAAGPLLADAVLRPAPAQGHTGAAGR